MGEADGIIDTEEMTQLNHSGVGESLVPFYYQCCYRILE